MKRSSAWVSWMAVLLRSVGRGTEPGAVTLSILLLFPLLGGAPALHAQDTLAARGGFADGNMGECRTDVRLVNQVSGWATPWAGALEAVSVESQGGVADGHERSPPRRPQGAGPGGWSPGAAPRGISPLEPGASQPGPGIPAGLEPEGGGEPPASAASVRPGETFFQNGISLTRYMVRRTYVTGGWE